MVLTLYIMNFFCNFGFCIKIEITLEVNEHFFVNSTKIHQLKSSNQCQLHHQT